MEIQHKLVKVKGNLLLNIIERSRFQACLDPRDYPMSPIFILLSLHSLFAGSFSGWLLFKQALAS